MNESFDSLPEPFLKSLASGSVVEACVSLARFSPWKFTVGFPGSSESEDERFPFFWKLFCPAQASMLSLIHI